MLIITFLLDFRSAPYTTELNPIGLERDLRASSTYQTKQTPLYYHRGRQSCSLIIFLVTHRPTFPGNPWVQVCYVQLYCHVPVSCVLVPDDYQIVCVPLLIPIIAIAGPGGAGSVGVHPVIFPLPGVNKFRAGHYQCPSTMVLGFGLSEEQLIC